MSDVPILVLAAGAASRMRGADKLLKDVGGEPLLRRQARIARAATDSRVIVALPPPPHPRHAALDGLDVQRVPVPDAAEGMNASLRAAFAALPWDAVAAMLLLGDLPELETADLRRVMDARAEHPGALIWRGATFDGKPGHPVLFDASLFERIGALTGDSGGREVVQAAGGRVHLVQLAGNRARRDLDTPEDWAAFQAESQD